MAEAVETTSPDAIPESFGAYGRAQALQQRIASTANDNSRDAEIVTMHPAASAADSIPKKFGAYGTNSTVASTVKTANDNPVWLNELGLTRADPTDFRQTWETDAQRFRRPTWRESYGGRLAIRAFSRGVLGAAFFSAGQIIAGNALNKYNPKFSYAELADKELISFKKPLDSFVILAAKTVDTTLGRAIKGAGKLIGVKNPEKLVTFRETRHYDAYGMDANNKPIFGRSLGHEGLGITFDFGMASLGDFTGREIAAIFDPNVRKDWMKDGHFSFTGWAKALGKNAWTGLTRSMGEDYFAMLMGYPYIVRMSRNVIDRFSPGFKYDSDNALNGGSIKIDDHGKIIGSYQLEGMADLGFRFTVYNMYTKAFRDVYDWTGSKISAWWKGDRKVHLPNVKPEDTTITGMVARSLRYVARVIIKMTIIMVPSTFFFYITRSPQTKDIGLAIHKSKGPIGVKARIDPKDPNSLEIFYPQFADGRFKSRRGELNEVDPTQKAIFENEPLSQNDPSPFPYFLPDKKNAYERRYDPYNPKNNFENPAPLKWYDKVTNPIGKACYLGGRALTETLKPFARALGYQDKDIGKVAKFSRAMAYASASYTPYFGMKTEVFSAAYDTPRMDMAIDRMLKGEFRAGVHDIMRVLRGQAFVDPGMERIAKEKDKTHRNQIWGQTDENRQMDDSQQVVYRPFAAREDLKRKPLTQLQERTSAAAGISPRNSDYRQQALKEFNDVTPQGQQVH